VVKVKNNQPKLKQALEQTVISTNPIDYYREEKITRGRLEIRQTWLYERENNLAQGWESIQRIALVERNFLSSVKEHKTDSLYVTDLQTNEAKYMAEGIRSHWGIENKLHYTKDVMMREDRECTAHKNAASNLALFRDFVFNILKTCNKSIKYASEIFANYNVKELYNIIIRT
jgi:predicted transposase YbfD/YdcC